MPVRIIALLLVKRSCDRNFTDAFAAFVACILEPSSLPIPVLTATMQIMQSSFPSKTADGSVCSLFIYAFYFYLPLSTEQTENVFVPVHSDECWIIAENTFQTWILLLSQMHVIKLQSSLLACFLSKLVWFSSLLIWILTFRFKNLPIFIKKQKASLRVLQNLIHFFRVESSHGKNIWRLEPFLLNCSLVSGSVWNHLFRWLHVIAFSFMTFCKIGEYQQKQQSEGPERRRLWCGKFKTVSPPCCSRLL